MKIENFDVRDADTETLMNKLGEALRRSMPSDCGFLLFVIKGDGEAANLFYISTEERSYAIQVMNDWIRRNTQ